MHARVHLGSVVGGGGMERAWPSVSKAPREAHVATQVGFLASGDEDLPAHRQLLGNRSSAARGQPPPWGPGDQPAAGGGGAALKRGGEERILQVRWQGGRAGVQARPGERSRSTRWNHPGLSNRWVPIEHLPPGSGGSRGWGPGWATQPSSTRDRDTIRPQGTCIAA